MCAQARTRRACTTPNLERGILVKTICRALIAGALALACGTVAAQVNWPAGKLIRIIVPFPAGGQTDIVARVIGQAIGE